MKKKFLLCLVLIALILSTIYINSVKAETEPFQKFTAMYIKTAEVKKGEKVYVDLYTAYDRSTKIIIYGVINNDPNRYISSEIKEINTQNPYFLLPNDVVIGDKFEMTMIERTDSTGTIKYSTAELDREKADAHDNCLGKKYVTVIGNEDEITLKNLAIKGSSQIKEDAEEIFFNVETNGNVDYISICMRDVKAPLNNALAYIEDLNGNPHINLKRASDKLKNGDYYVSDVFLSGKNGKVSVHYSNYSRGGDIIPLDFDVKFSIGSENTSNNQNNGNEVIKLNSLEISQNTAKKNDKVYVNLSTNKKISQAMLSFANENEDDMMVVYLKGLTTDKPYFIVPYTTEIGTYSLNYAILYDAQGNKQHYRKGPEAKDIKHFDFNSQLTIEEANKEDINLLSLDNEKITMDIIDQIYNMEGNITIEINANNNPIIDEALFEAIKGSNKTIIIKYNNSEWVFNGKDVKNAKSIDVSTNIYKTSDNEMINKKIDTGLILDFAENGELPGKCLIRIKSAENISNVLNNNVAKVYYYNENEDNFDKVKMHTILTDDNYYEFYINHNSKYVMTVAEIDNKYVSNQTNDLVLNEQNSTSNSNTKASENKANSNSVLDNKTFLMLIIIIGLCIVVIVLVVSEKANKKNKKSKDK